MDFYYVILEFLIFVCFSAWFYYLFNNPKHFYLKLFIYVFGYLSLMILSPIIRRKLDILDYFFENPFVIVYGPLVWIIFLFTIIHGILKRLKKI